MHLFRHTSLACALFALVTLSACADMPHDMAKKSESTGVSDPIEDVNRVVFDVNDFLDRLLLRPLAELYRATIPPGIRDRVANIVSNMNEPVVMANNLLQGEFSNAGTTLARFGTNTTLGVAGAYDFATSFGLPQQSGDFGQTLATWGAGEGAYLVLPLFGPSNIRDAVGLGVDMLMSPWQYLANMGSQGTQNRLSYSSAAASGIVRREQNIEGLEALKAGSLDFYAQMRSVYHQYRMKKLGGEMPQPAYDEDE